MFLYRKYCTTRLDMWPTIHVVFPLIRTIGCSPRRCQLQAGMMLFLHSLGELHKLWREGLSDEESKTQPFHLRPKAHLLQHLVCDQLEFHGNPSHSWCYADESYVGCIKRVASNTKDPRTLEQRLGEKSMLKAGPRTPLHRRTMHCETPCGSLGNMGGPSACVRAPKKHSIGWGAGHGMHASIAPDREASSQRSMPKRLKPRGSDESSVLTPEGMQKTGKGVGKRQKALFRFLC